MPFIASRNRVQDYATWKQAYDQGAAMRREMGVERQQILRNPDDPNEFLLLVEVDDLEQARRAMQSDELRTRLQRRVYYPEA